MKTDEDEAFEQIEQARGWRKRQIANEVEFTLGLDPYREMVRNQTLDEVARAIRSEEHTSEPVTLESRMPSSA